MYVLTQENTYFAFSAISKSAESILESGISRVSSCKVASNFLECPGIAECRISKCIDGIDAMLPENDLTIG